MLMHVYRADDVVLQERVIMQSLHHKYIASIASIHLGTEGFCLLYTFRNMVCTRLVYGKPEQTTHPPVVRSWWGDLVVLAEYGFDLTVELFYPYFLKVY